MKPVPIAIKWKWKTHYANIIIEGLTAFFPPRPFLFLYGFLGSAQSDCNILTSGEIAGWIATQHIEDTCDTVGTPGICTLGSF